MSDLASYICRQARAARRVRPLVFTLLLALGLCLPGARLRAQDPPPSDVVPNTDVGDAAAVTTVDAADGEAETERKADGINDYNPLMPVKTDTPHDTLETFIKAMKDYKQGLDSGDKLKQARIQDAVQCLDLEGFTLLGREERGREAAIYLKEVMDRVIFINFALVPDNAELASWRFPETEIRMVKKEDGDRVGEYLFSKNTVESAGRFFNKVKHLPYMKGVSGAGYSEPWYEREGAAWAKGATLGVANWQWAGLFIAILVGLLVKVIVTWIVHGLKRLTDKSTSKWDDLVVLALERPAGLIAASGLWFFTLHLLRFEGTMRLLLEYTVQIIFSYAIIWACYRLVDVVSAWLQHLTAKTETKLDDQLVPMVRRALRIFTVVFGVLVTCQNLGADVKSVLAGLGLGGLAFALAARDTCANFFGSIMIILDRPFQVGDWVISGNVEGTVEEIGFRSTRIRTFYNSVISVPNSLLANQNIDNMGAREYRRIRAYFGLTYDTPVEKIEAFVEGVKNIVKANPWTRKDYFHVVFNNYGPDNLEVMLYCFLKVPDWGAELVERQNIYLEVLRLAETLEVEFAFPTQTLHMESFPGKEPLRGEHVVDRDELSAAALAFGPGGNLAHPAGAGIFTPPYAEPTAGSAKTRGNGDSGE